MKRIKQFLDNNKKNLIALLFLPALLSLVLLVSLFNKSLSTILLNFHVEIIAISVAWIILAGFIIIWKRLKGAHPINLVLIILIAGVTLVASYPHIKKIAIGRYVFYTHGLYKLSHNDVKHIESAINAFMCKEWTLAKSHLDSCSSYAYEFFSFSTSNLYSEIDKVETSTKNFSIILDRYELTPSMLELYSSLAHDFGGTLQENYSATCQTVLNNIDNIERLYDAINCDNAEECKSLISEYGKYWFEPELKEEILNSSDLLTALRIIVMKNDNGKQYKRNIRNVWGV